MNRASVPAAHAVPARETPVHPGRAFAVHPGRAFAVHLGGVPGRVGPS